MNYINACVIKPTIVICFHTSNEAIVDIRILFQVFRFTVPDVATPVDEFEDSKKKKKKEL